MRGEVLWWVSRLAPDIQDVVVLQIRGGRGVC